jgi:prevent-host-death family protein
MPQREPITQTIKASEARAQWSELLNKVFRRQTRVIVEKSGIPVAAIISAQDLERLSQMEDRRRERFKALGASWDAFKDEDPTKVEQEVAQAVAEARRKIRQDAPAG